jgi:regulator of PEP synthase PpsR (kinase-PPPase family)
MGWPVIDVTRRSIEETAAEILKILARRQQTVEEPAPQ